ncbi:MAG: UvrD-helicase domain-containing protein [bacterium]
MQLVIKDSDITYVETILLKDGQHFDEERKEFIKNFGTLDLQAVPGSGKTTALLAKLLIIEKYLPLKNGSGILVISHTNTAVNEIKDKIEKYCPKLFSYPNFVGTIQGFVDKYLAIPMYLQKYKKKPVAIDTEYYNNMNKIPKECLGWLNNQHFDNKKEFVNSIRLLDDNTLGYFDGLDFQLKDKSSKTYKGLLELKLNLMKNGILCYDDAYVLGKKYIISYPITVNIIQARFQYVFVDEMQDMVTPQHDILEDLFVNENVIYQRLGDKNQAIFSEGNKNLEVWKSRSNKLTFSKSHRLSQYNSDIVNRFAIEPNIIIGNNVNNSNNPPQLIVFSEPKNVLPKFTELVKKIINPDILFYSKLPIKCVGWIKKDTEDPKKFNLKSYYSEYQPTTGSNAKKYINLMSFLVYHLHVDKSKNSLTTYRKTIIEAILFVFRNNLIKHNNRFLTEKVLIKILKEMGKEYYDDFLLNILKWSKNLFYQRYAVIHNEILEYLPIITKLFNAVDFKPTSFLTDLELHQINPQGDFSQNIYHCPKTGLDVEVGTVHSVKGETHLATLFVETYYKKNFESERLLQMFLNKKPKDMNQTVKASAKIAYVAMSRPTHLLCVAIQKDRFEKIKEKESEELNKWEIIYI